jgi:hypothetical protein
MVMGGTEVIESIKGGWAGPVLAHLKPDDRQELEDFLAGA